MKRNFFLAGLLTALLLCFGLVGGASALTVRDSGSCGSGLTWVLSTDGSLSIVGSGSISGYNPSGSGTAPWSAYRASITSVSIDEGVTSIGTYAFHGCSALTKVSLPSTMKALNEACFSGCTSLGSVTIPSSVVYIGTHALGFQISGGSWKTISGFRVSGYSGSAAESYAASNSLTFTALDAGVAKQFSDVNATDWFTPYVQTAYDKGLMTGYSDTEFCPQGGSTRAQFVQSLFALHNKPTVQASADFSDVSSSDWFSSAVSWAVANGITSGTSETTFEPYSSVTREQMALFLYADAGRPSVSGNLTGFADVLDLSPWAYKAILWATTNGIIAGSSEADGLYLNPGKAATRAEVAAMLCAYVG